MSLSVFETRKSNLRKIVFSKFEGRRSLFSRATGVHENHANLLLSDNETHRRNMGEAMARRIEEKLELAPGYMDHQHDGEDLHSIQRLNVPANMLHLFHASDDINSIVVRPHFFSVLAGKASSVNNLFVCAIATSEMAPRLLIGDQVIFDAGVKAFYADGFYVIQLGGASLLCRISKSLAGGWSVEGGSKSTTLDSLRGIKVLGKVVMSLQMRVL